MVTLRGSASSVTLHRRLDEAGEDEDDDDGSGGVMIRESKDRSTLSAM